MEPLTVERIRERAILGNGSGQWVSLAQRGAL